jgi:hypothetical protein
LATRNRLRLAHLRGPPCAPVITYPPRRAIALSARRGGGKSAAPVGLGRRLAADVAVWRHRLPAIGGPAWRGGAARRCDMQSADQQSDPLAPPVRRRRRCRRFLQRKRAIDIGVSSAEKPRSAKRLSTVSCAAGRGPGEELFRECRIGATMAPVRSPASGTGSTCATARSRPH